MSLLSDSILSLKEEVLEDELHEINADTSFLPFEFMQLFNFISLIFIVIHFAAVYYTGELANCLSMVSHNWLLVELLLKYSILTSLGQIMVFFILSEYGPLNLSVITTFRKIFSVIFSVILFDKKLENVQMAGIGLSFALFIYEIYVKLRPKPKVKTN